MSRSGYSDSLDSWKLIMWRGAVASAIRGKRGQAFLGEMLAAMDALPNKRLISGELVAESGEVCAIGSVCAARGIDVSDLNAVYDWEYPMRDKLAERVGIAKALTAEIMFENDEAYYNNETPEHRFMRVREWIVRNLKEQP